LNTTAGSASKDMGPPGRPSLIDRGASNGDMQNANPSQYRMDAKDNIVQLDESPDQDGAQQPDSLHRRTSQNRDNQRMSDMDDDDMDRSENSEGNIEPESESDQDETAADKYELRYPYSRLQEAQVLLQRAWSILQGNLHQDVRSPFAAHSWQSSNAFYDFIVFLFNCGLQTINPAGTLGVVLAPILNILILFSANHEMRLITSHYAWLLYFGMSFMSAYAYLTCYKSYDIFRYRQVYQQAKGIYRGPFAAQNEDDDEKILRYYRKQYPGMTFRYTFVDKVEAEDSSAKGRIMGLLKKAAVQRYSSQLRSYFIREYNPDLHVRILNVHIWHFNRTYALYFLFLNPIFVVSAAFSEGYGLFYIDPVIILFLCILLALVVHDDSKMEGESLLLQANAAEVQVSQEREHRMKQKNGKVVHKYLRFLNTRKGQEEM